MDLVELSQLCNVTILNICYTCQSHQSKMTWKMIWDVKLVWWRLWLIFCGKPKARTIRYFWLFPRIETFLDQNFKYLTWWRFKYKPHHLSLLRKVFGATKAVLSVIQIMELQCWYTLSLWQKESIRFTMKLTWEKILWSGIMDIALRS